MRTKAEILSDMREHQAAYAKAATELKELTIAEETAQFQERQLKRLEEYKTKYFFFADREGAVKAIDWEEVEKLVRSSFGQEAGYALGFDDSGMEGLGYNYGGAGAFNAMVEDETDARRYVEREKRRAEWKAKAKK